MLSTLTNALLLPITMLTFNLPILGSYQESFNEMTLLGLIFVLIGFTIWRMKSFPCYNRINEELIEDEETKLTSSSSSTIETTITNRPPSPMITCVACGIDYENRSRTSSGESLYGHAPDAFYDRVIVLSLDG